jgi:acyl phosphate:glycerol-3-phosphate acyltransferase
MTAGRALALLAVAYLVGSIPWSFLIVKLARGVDVRTVGSGNVGATNVLRTAGKKAGVIALVLDLAKGVAAVLVSRRVGAPPEVVACSGVAVVLGHIFPIFLRFRGGKGVATAAGALGALEPRVLLASLLLFLAVVAWKRYVSLGSIVVAAAFPLFLWIAQRLDWEERDSWQLLGSFTICLIVIAKHRTNIERLWKGTERRLGEPRPDSAQPAGEAGL